MQRKYRYIGVFFGDLLSDPRVASLGGGKLYRKIKHFHVTFSYMPEQVNEELFGEKVRVKVVGYGCDGENEGLSVVVAAQSPELQQMAERIAVPHITLSVCKRGQSVNTARLNYTPVEPFELEGVFGGMAMSGEKILNNSKTGRS